jgi:hypothetical protein
MLHADLVLNIMPRPPSNAHIIHIKGIKLYSINFSSICVLVMVARVFSRTVLIDGIKMFSKNPPTITTRITYTGKPS